MRGNVHLALHEYRFEYLLRSRVCRRNCRGLGKEVGGLTVYQAARGSISRANSLAYPTM